MIVRLAAHRKMRRQFFCELLPIGHYRCEKQLPVRAIFSAQFDDDDSRMRYLTWMFRFLLFVALLGFAIKNNEIVSLRYLFGYEWQAPLVVALFVFLLIGVVIGILAMMDMVIRLRRELARARDEANRQRSPQPQAAESASPEQSS